MAQSAAPSEAEVAVRDYLNYLSDPDSLIDPALIARLQAEVSKAKDPVDKLRSIAALERAHTADPERYERAFVEQAKIWAAAADVPASAFQQLGVPADVLRAAGIIVVGGRGRSRGGGTKPATSGRRAPVKAADLESGILELNEPFSVKDVSDRVGGSTVTIKAAIDRLEAQGKVVGAGDRPGSRGRASRTWTVAVEPL
jgi:hypothetical protein